jgi:hypothetical protein
MTTTYTLFEPTYDIHTYTHTHIHTYTHTHIHTYTHTHIQLAKTLKPPYLNPLLLYDNYLLNPFLLYNYLLNPPMTYTHTHIHTYS